jgi:hypothetical protein
MARINENRIKETYRLSEIHTALFKGEYSYWLTEKFIPYGV